MEELWNYIKREGLTSTSSHPLQDNTHLSKVILDLSDKTNHQVNITEQLQMKQSHLANPAGIPDPQNHQI